MLKYSYAFKKRIVNAYLNGEGGYDYLVEKYGIKNKRQVYDWVQNYEKFGDNGLKNPGTRKEYSFEFKRSVVESYLSSELTYKELALSLGIINSSLIANWVTDYRKHGIEALLPRKRGLEKILNKPKEKKHDLPSTLDVDTSVEHVKELEDELLKLRIENAFLKELRRLRLEDEAKMRERHESSTASEDSLN